MSRILIVDDESSITRLLSLVFRDAGYQVRTASTAAEAMSLCGSERFDAMLADVIIYDSNGHDLVRWVASHHPQVRCALMSGYDLECHGCPLSPRCLLVTKPFHPVDVVSLMGDLLASSRIG